MECRGNLSVLLNHLFLFKACLHDGPEVDPDCRDMDLSGRGSASQEIVAEFVRKHFKGVHDRPSIVELCMYTQTVSASLLCMIFGILLQTNYGCLLRYRIMKTHFLTFIRSIPIS